MKSKKEAIVLLIVVFIILLGIRYNLNVTGFFGYNPADAYQPAEHIWNFSNSSDYSFNSSLMNFTSNGIMLMRLPLFYEWSESNSGLASITTALVDEMDNDTGKVTTLDDQFSSIDEDEKLEMKFNSTLNNNDVIMVYLKSMSKEVKIYLCPIGVGLTCNTSNYGLAATSSTGDVSAAITISNLPSPTNQLDINVNDTTKIDYINSTYNSVTTYNATNYTYQNASIQTSDIATSNIISLNLFSSLTSLNGQEIIYSYSDDSGSTWNNITDSNMSSINISSGTIRFNATLLSNSTETPILHSISLGYYALCTENWSCSEWSSCQNNLKTRSCIETNACIAPENKPVESSECGHFTRTITAQKIELSLITSSNTSNVSITTALYGNNKSNVSGIVNVENIEVEAGNEISSTLVNATFKYYYNLTEVNSLDLNISTLSFYFFNETLGNWSEIGTYVNSSGNFIEANLEHFSTFGVFGSLNSNGNSGSSGGSSGGGSSGGGGGGRSSSSVSSSSTPSMQEGTSSIKAVGQNPEKEIKEQAIETAEVDNNENSKGEKSEMPITGKATTRIDGKKLSILLVVVIALVLSIGAAYYIKKQKVFKFGSRTKKR